MSDLKQIFDNPNQFNNCIPHLGMAEGLPPGVTFRFALISLSPDPLDQDVYRQGSRKVPVEGGKNRWDPEYALTKRGLTRLLGAAQLDVQTGTVETVPGRNELRRVTMIVQARRMDGSYRDFPGTAELDIEAEVSAFRSRLEAELAGRGKLVRARWDDGKKRDQTYEGDKAHALIDLETGDFEARVRKFAIAMVETKAILRATKGIFALKDTYTVEELKRPFVIYWYQFPPQDFSGTVWPQPDPPHVDPTPVAPPPQEPTVQEPSKPTIGERLKMLRDPESGFSTDEATELVTEICTDMKKVPVPDTKGWTIDVFRVYVDSLLASGGGAQ